jgi:LacI family transcriptional regulator
MTSKFSIKQIAAQAGTSTATVDRVLNNRDCVRYQTQLRVNEAIAELEEQSGLIGQFGRTLYIDVIMQAPDRFTDAVRQAMLQAASSMSPCCIRPRFHLFEAVSVFELNKLILACKTNGSHGLILKAPDEGLINDSIAALSCAGVPVVTLVTDLPFSQRIAYIGMDNRAAGRTAAYLLDTYLQGLSATVAVIISSQVFRGEEEREMGFRAQLREQSSALKLVEIPGGQGLYQQTYDLVTKYLQQDESICAVYSVGGGNCAIIAAFSDLNRPLRFFIAHDLDQENRSLLMDKKIDLVIDHHLEDDARRAFSHILQHQKVLPKSLISSTQINVVTPYNL